MKRLHRHIDVECHNDVYCARLLHHKLDETQIQEFSDELLTLILDAGCRKLVLSLGPEAPECLYSIFLAKLFTIRRRMLEVGGVMKLCDANPDVIGVFEACHLKQFFEFVPDRETAIAGLTK